MRRIPLLWYLRFIPVLFSPTFNSCCLYLIWYSAAYLLYRCPYFPPWSASPCISVVIGASQVVMETTQVDFFMRAASRHGRDVGEDTKSSYVFGSSTTGVGRVSGRCVDPLSRYIRLFSYFMRPLKPCLDTNFLHAEPFRPCQIYGATKRNAALITHLF